MFDDAQLAAGVNVAVLGTAASEQLFGAGANPLGQSLDVRGRTYSIVGDRCSVCGQFRVYSGSTLLATIDTP